MNNERRKELAALSFTEKVRLLEKLRDRSLAFAEARKQLAEKKKPMELDWSKCDLVEVDPLRASGSHVVKGTRLPVEDIIANYEFGVSVAEISKQFGIDAQTIKSLLLYAQEHYALTRPL